MWWELAQRVFGLRIWRGVPEPKETASELVASAEADGGAYVLPRNRHHHGGVTRDAAALGGRTGAEIAYRSRYRAAARLYIDAMHAAERADVVVDNDDLDHPVIHCSVEGAPAPSSGETM
jgi:hypothetical protein